MEVRPISRSIFCRQIASSARLRRLVELVHMCPDRDTCVHAIALVVRPDEGLGQELIPLEKKKPLESLADGSVRLSSGRRPRRGQLVAGGVGWQTAASAATSWGLVALLVMPASAAAFARL